MSSPIVAIAADHAGFPLKGELAAVLLEHGYQILDLGTHGPESVDYPDIAERLTVAIREGQAERGVLICGTGIGIGIAANRFPGIRAATCTSGLVGCVQA